MTDNEIIKALECCVHYEDCNGCPSFVGTDSEWDCQGIDWKSILDLINRQQAEIERLLQKSQLPLEIGDVFIDEDGRRCRIDSWDMVCTVETEGDKKLVFSKTKIEEIVGDIE